MEGKNKNKIIAIIAAAAAVILIICIIAVNSGKKEEKSALVPADGQTASQNADSDATDSADDSSSDTQNQAEEQVKVTPTFMYFISGNDQDFEATNAMIAELQAEYSDKINFDIVNVDEHPEALENFPVADQTPVLIMLNTANDISAIEFMCNDRAVLEEDIQKALE